MKLKDPLTKWHKLLSIVENNCETRSVDGMLIGLNLSQGIIIQGNNNPTYTQQSSPIPIDTNHQRHQQHSPLHHQSYPNNQITAEKMMSYRNANTASPANLSSSQGNLSKVGVTSSFPRQLETNVIPQIHRIVTATALTVAQAPDRVRTTCQACLPTSTQTQVLHAVPRRWRRATTGASHSSPLPSWL